MVLTAVMTVVAGGVSPASAGQPSNGDIVFRRCAPAAPDCYTYSINADGTDLHKLHVDEWQWSDLSEDGARILFQLSAAPSTLLVMDADGTDVVPVASGGTFGVPTWSPDASKIAFTRLDGVCNFAPDLWVMDADGTNATNLMPGCVNNGTLAFGSVISWSPDGTQLAFRGETGGTGGLIVMDADGTDPHVIVSFSSNPNVINPDNPSWSPDGTKILFDGADATPDPGQQTSGDLWTTNLTGTVITQLTHTLSAAEFFPVWSPDGTRIVYDRLDLRQDSSFTAYTMWTADADGTDAAVLTNPFPDEQQNVGDYYPQWGSGSYTGQVPPAQCESVDVTVDLSLGQQPTEGPDVILGTPAADTINALGGDDRVCGGGGNDVINGGSGLDRLFGQAGVDTLHGNGKADYLDGGSEVDHVFGDAGADLLFGKGGGDELVGGDGGDTISGSAGADHAFGQAGNDTVNGGDGGDALDGGADNDHLNGGAGTDSCNGRTGTDQQSGCEVRSNIP